jgi:Flp pilus assembly protein CpaB
VDQAAGKMTLSNMYPGDWVLSSRLADTKGASGVSFTMDEGLVMVTFPASDIIGTGAVRPGDTVDVIVTIDTSKENGPVGPGAPSGSNSPGGTTQLTVQNLKVQNIGVVANSAGGQPTAPDAQSKVITFAVSRQDALALKQIKDYPNSRAEMVLRSAGDDKIYTVDAVNMRALIERFNIRATP